MQPALAGCTCRKGDDESNDKLNPDQEIRPDRYFLRVEILELRIDGMICFFHVVSLREFQYPVSPATQDGQEQKRDASNQYSYPPWC